VAISDSQLEALCRIPVQRAQWASLYGSVRRSGYAAIRDRITPAILAEYIAAHADFIPAWESYSSDKRTDGGWYLQRTNEGCEVGSLTIPYPREVFTDRAIGCAEFILREVECINCLWPWRRPRWPRHQSRQHSASVT